MINKMNIIITMGGLGARFRAAGYHVPKYMIQARGKTLFEWSMDSLLDYNRVVGKYVFLARKDDHSTKFIEEQCAKCDIQDFEIVELERLTDGQATTALIGTECVHELEPVMIYNIDTYVEPYAMKLEAISGDGHIPCFHADGNHWSFVRTDAEERVVEVREKVRISSNCTLGAYYFSSAALYKKLYHAVYDGWDKELQGEKYVAPLYDRMLKEGYEVTMSLVPADRVHVLGTPEELAVFIGA